MKHLHLELVKATESGAIAASKQVGRGDKMAADHAATDAMRNALNSIHFAGKVVVGEGRKDNAPGLFADELIGCNWHKVDGNNEQYYDLAIDPLEGTTPTARGGYEAMSVIAMGERNSLFSAQDFYMNKIAVGPQIAGKVDLHLADPITRTIRLVSLATDKPPTNITVCLLDRPRHDTTVAELRKLGCRIKFIQDCDVSGILATAIPESGVDLFLGIGGTPEGVIAACALKCMGGVLQGMLCDKEGKPVDGKMLEMDMLAKGDVVFCATGVLPGMVLDGITYDKDYAITHSLLMESRYGSISSIKTSHKQCVFGSNG